MQLVPLYKRPVPWGKGRLYGREPLLPTGQRLLFIAVVIQLGTQQSAQAGSTRVFAGGGLA